MGRWIARILGGLLLLVVVLSLPILWVEGMCATSPRAPDQRPAPLVDDRGYVRRESDSYLSYPEWHIVYAYEDLAGVLQRGNASGYAYGRQIVGFWSDLCALTRVVTAREKVATDTKVMLYTIGWSFTVELAVKGAWENTIGRFTEWLRGDRPTAEDVFVARDMQAYARFLRQTPWYQYPFLTRLRDFWRQTPWRGEHWPRKLERRISVSLEYAIKAVYGAVIGAASSAALGAADLEIYTVMAGLDASDQNSERDLHVVRELGGARTLVRTPRYQAYTELLVRLARRGRNVVEIAGNRRILITVLVPAGRRPSVAGTTELFEAPIQSRPDRRRLGLDVVAEQLGPAIRALEAGGATIEHIYDY